MMRPVGANSLPDSHFAARPADFPTFSQAREPWEKVYAVCGESYRHQIIQSALSRHEMPIYFNAGVLCLNRAESFANTWMQFCLRIDQHPDIANKRPFLDQIALPPALSAHSWSYAILDEPFNYPAHIKPLHPDFTPVFCHYHYPGTILAEPSLSRFVWALMDEVPEIVSLMEKHPHWRDLNETRSRFYPVIVDWHRVWKKQQQPNLLISGVPRSGTSFLTSVLNRQANVVVVNEPAQVFIPLQRSRYPWGIAMLYRQFRSDLLLGKGIANKTVDQSKVPDTYKNNSTRQTYPHVEADDLLIGMKNTIACLSRIACLRRVMPDLQIITCIRHPYDTIDSWVNSFPHLRHAAVEHLPVGGLNDPFISEAARERLAIIGADPDLMKKRALLWRHFAELIKEQHKNTVWVRYEDLSAAPLQVLEALSKFLGRELCWSDELSVVTSSRRQELSRKEQASINEICWPIASHFGYAPDQK